MASFPTDHPPSLSLSLSPKRSFLTLKLPLSPTDRSSVKPPFLPSLSPQKSLLKDESSLADRSGLYPEWLENRKDFKELRSRYEKLDSIDIFVVCGKAGIQRNDFERKAVVRSIKACPFFSSMKGDQLIDLADRMHSVFFASGDTLIGLGDLADSLYVILSGRVGIYIENNECIDEVTQGNVVGESAIHSRGYRSATVRAHGDVKTLKLTYEDFDNVAFKLKLQDFYNVANFLGTLDYFSEWNKSKLYRLASIMIVKQYQQGQKVYKRGEVSHDLYIVRHGVVHLKVDVDLEQSNRWPTGSHQWTCVSTTKRYEKTLKECLPGDFFGERELIDNTPLNATAICMTPSALLFIIRQEFFSEIFSDKDRKMLYHLADNRPRTNQLRFQLELEKKQEHMKTEAMLNAINTNSLPNGRELFHSQSEIRRIEWARRLVNRLRQEDRQGIVKQVKKVKTIPEL